MIGRTKPGGGRRFVYWPWLVTTVLAVSSAACFDSLLEVEHTDIILPANLDGPEGLATLYAGAIGDFATGWRSDLVGIFTDEFAYGGVGFRVTELDSRSITATNPLVRSLFHVLHRARAALENVTTALQTFSADPASDDRLPETLALAGYTYLFLGETFCNGVPVSTVGAGGDLQLGPPLSNAELFTIAIGRFDAALAGTAGSAQMEYLARVGKGRALLNLDQFDQAATVVQAVPDEFTYAILHSENNRRQYNLVYDGNTVAEEMSVWDLEGTNGLPFRSAGDPRVPWARNPGNDTGNDRQTPQYDFLGYTSRADPEPLATGVEARLIEAEAALRNNDASWITILDDLRTNSGLDFSGVPGVADQGGLDANVDLLFSERAFWMYATGHRLPDMRRLIRQFGRDAETVFPTGAYFKGGPYGADVTFPIPFQEESSNPNSTGCTDRAA